MLDERDIRYVVSLSLEEAASGCEKAIKIRASQVCPSCDGSGESSGLDSAACPECHGVGRTYQVHLISAQIPAGVEDGCQVHINTQGQVGLQAEIPRELEVVVSIKAHRLFERSGDDIIYEMPLSFTQAALGTEVMVPTLKDDVRLTIPRGTQTGRVFRFRGKGIPHFGRRGKGDYLVRIRIITPTSLDEHQRWLFEQLAKSLPEAKLGEGNGRDGGSGDG